MPSYNRRKVKIVCTLGPASRTPEQIFALIDGLTVQCLMLPRSERHVLIERTLEPYIASLESNS